MKVVFDAGVVLAGAGWRHESHWCLVAFARRRIQAYASAWLLNELRTVADELKHEFAHPPWPILNWYGERVRLVSPVPLGKPRCRDEKDDPYLACALAAKAQYIVSRDRDLLSLQKPFGIEIITPRLLLSRLNRPL